ncbi:NUDIX hydrolase [Catelliglobosispora koreensis]|uniref:NUDIX hydrolase n=1 Tax=Catelliglobosispora koreensis TaxID=129052 RepID=UPI0003A55606|nr:NUDIX hydrolase [Catelliglobosispora koreensis]
MRCHDCGYEHYVNPRPTASLLILNDRDELLLLKRARDPKKGMWETPGGFCDTWEEPADAAVREGREELGVDVHLGPFAGMWIGSYEFQGELLSVLDCFWWARLPHGASLIIDPQETLEYQWFSLRDLPELAFSTMTRAVQCQKPDRFE